LSRAGDSTFRKKVKGRTEKTGANEGRICQGRRGVHSGETRIRNREAEQVTGRGTDDKNLFPLLLKGVF